MGPPRKVVPIMNEWVIVGVVVLIAIFGASKLPQIARNMGKAQGEFKKGLKEGAVENEAETSAPAPASTQPTQASEPSAPPAAPPGDAQASDPPATQT